MQFETIQDRQHYAMGTVARHVGISVDAYRPTGPLTPISESQRFLKLHAAFEPADGGLAKAGRYGSAEWHGIFDASYTRPGDYLVGGDRIFFIAAQQPLLPVLCILANRMISMSRPFLQTGSGSNSYGGYTTRASSELIAGWPASILGISGGAEAPSGLPAAQATHQMTVLLPSVPTTVIMPGDMIADDLGRNMVVAATEHTQLGWRFSARLVTA